MSNEKDTLHKVERAVFGTLPDGSDGMAAIVRMHSNTLYGTDRDPGGLEKSVRTLTRTLWVCTGSFITLEILLRIIPMLKN